MQTLLHCGSNRTCRNRVCRNPSSRLRSTGYPLVYLGDHLLVYCFEPSLGDRRPVVRRLKLRTEGVAHASEEHGHSPHHDHVVVETHDRVRSVEVLRELLHVHALQDVRRVAVAVEAHVAVDEVLVHVSRREPKWRRRHDVHDLLLVVALQCYKKLRHRHPLLQTQLFHLAVVDEAQPSVIHQQDVTRVGVPIEDPIREDLVRVHLHQQLQDFPQLDGLLPPHITYLAQREPQGVVVSRPGNVPDHIAYGERVSLESGYQIQGGDGPFYGSVTA
mmetsp:Transcript_15784/g.26639  ORF Transcript_15784/g.26639 Transcript_15784/m.26639 type:complete len:274 (+) Transcript_15784:102-923(+)